MHLGKTYKWISRQESRKSVLQSLHIPSTATQLSAVTGMDFPTCSYIISKMTKKGLSYCLNPTARIGRLYFPTAIGLKCQHKLFKLSGKPLPPIYDIPNSPIDWTEYGWVCFSHRQTVLRSLTKPMQPSEIKRKITQRSPQARISANNVRDVIYDFLRRGIVRQITLNNQAHRQYQLTDKGLAYQQLLNRQISF